MAHRFYLYALKEEQQEGSSSEGHPNVDITAVGEARLEIPYAFSVLCSASPRQVESFFFTYDEGELIAIQSEFSEGVRELMAFLDALEERLELVTTIPEDVDAAKLHHQIHQTREYFSNPRFEGCSSFLLEGAEVFALVANEPDSMQIEVRTALDDLKHPESTVAHVLENMLPDGNQGSSSQISSPGEIQLYLGLDCWSRLVWLMTEDDASNAKAEREDGYVGTTASLVADSSTSGATESPGQRPSADQTNEVFEVSGAAPWWKRLLGRLGGGRH